jgi:hypothetical protein
MHANGLHLGEKIRSEKTSTKHSKLTVKGRVEFKIVWY